MPFTRLADQVAEVWSLRPLGARSAAASRGSCREEDGQLFEAVRWRPYSVVLLDEIEKAHPDVMHLLLQILEEVKITDSLGQKIEIEDPLAEEFLRREVGLLPE